MLFNKLFVHGNEYHINNPTKFVPLGAFHDSTIDTVFDFAYEMSFGNGGEHRSYRSGGMHHRSNGEIFANTFQGKLAECAVYNQLSRFCKMSMPDFSTYGLGEWDRADFYIDRYKVSIKSTKAYGNLLLLETKDWSINGVYLPNNEAYDFTFLVRLNPFCEDLLRSNRMLYSNSVNKGELQRVILNKTWEYDVPGYVTLDDLMYVINNDYVLPQSALLNGKTKMDAENYYIQSGDMRRITDFIKEL